MRAVTQPWESAFGAEAKKPISKAAQPLTALMHLETRINPEFDLTKFNLFCYFPPHLHEFCSSECNGRCMFYLTQRQNRMLSGHIAPVMTLNAPQEG